ncbi:MAG: hypothetical protein V1723_03320 [Candidatus Uhrbacteria bacterium]
MKRNLLAAMVAVMCVFVAPAAFAGPKLNELSGKVDPALKSADEVYAALENAIMTEGAATVRAVQSECGITPTSTGSLGPKTQACLHSIAETLASARATAAVAALPPAAAAPAAPAAAAAVPGAPAAAAVPPPGAPAQGTPAVAAASPPGAPAAATPPPPLPAKTDGPCAGSNVWVCATVAVAAGAVGTYFLIPAVSDRISLSW